MTSPQPAIWPSSSALQCTSGHTLSPHPGEETAATPDMDLDPHGEEARIRTISGQHAACAPSRTMKARLRPQSFETRARARSSEGENVSGFCPENFTFDGLEDGDRKAFRSSRHRMTAIWLNLPSANPMLAVLFGRLLAWVLLFMPLPAPWLARRGSASCCERPRTTTDGCGP